MYYNFKRKCFCCVRCGDGGGVERMASHLPNPTPPASRRPLIDDSKLLISLNLFLPNCSLVAKDKNKIKVKGTNVVNKNYCR